MPRGGYVHYEVMLSPLAEAFEGVGWRTDMEVPVRLGETVGFVDMVAEMAGHCIAVEAECCSKRVERDLDKAQALQADELWIVVPNTAVAQSVRRALARMWVRADRGGLFVLTQAAALSRVRSYLPLFAGA